MLKPDQAPVVGAQWKMVDIANEAPNALGRHLGDHELLWSFGDETATTQVLSHGSQQKTHGDHIRVLLGALTTTVGLLTVS